MEQQWALSFFSFPTKMPKAVEMTFGSLDILQNTQTSISIMVLGMCLPVAVAVCGRLDEGRS